MADRTGLGGPAALGDFATINGLLYDAYQEGSGGKLTWRPRAAAPPTNSDRAYGYHDYGDITGAVTWDLDAGPSRNKRANLTGNVTITVISSLIGTFLASIKTNGFTVTVNNVIWSGAAATWTSPTVHDTKQWVYEGNG